MKASYDLIVRNGLVVDGSGAPPREADVAVTGTTIAAVGRIEARGTEEIDAKGRIVTPGFVDIHTHYDGHVTWEHRLVPSASHGVTTIAMGNCGVGFAPCKPDERELLIRLMEGVEDIPYPVLAEGVPWTWQSFPEYLDFIAARQYDMDVCGYVPHAALRVFAMGRRGADREPATPADRALMTQLASEALHAGAIGVSTSRTLFHRSSDGKAAPTFQAANDELLALGDAIRQSGRGVLQMIQDLEDTEAAFAQMRDLAAYAGTSLTFTLLEGQAMGPVSPRWREVLDWCAGATRAGVPIKAQVTARPVSILLGHELTLNPFYTTPTYKGLATLPFAEKIAALRQPQIRAAILAEATDPDPTNVLGRLVRKFHQMYVLGDPPQYEPSREAFVDARAVRIGTTPEALAYDLMLERDGRTMLNLVFTNYEHGSLDSCFAMLQHAGSVFGLGDGGAHCATICDGSMPSFMLTHWTRDRRGSRPSLATAVRWMTSDTARTIGLADRGMIAPGFKADLNVIDIDRLHLRAPTITRDLPGGAARLVQSAEGYDATIVSGAVVYRAGQASGALPGRLVRGQQPAPRA